MKLFSFSYEFVPRPDSRQSKLAATVIEYGNKTKWRVVGRAPSAPAAEPWEATFFFLDDCHTRAMWKPRWDASKWTV